MKLILITSIKEDLEQVTKIMEEAGIAVFSVSEVVGHKTEHHDYRVHNWFGRSGEGTASLVFFSFCPGEAAQKAMELIRSYNERTHSRFPVRGILMPVEATSF